MIKNKRPPLGVMPNHLWVQHRIDDLAREIYEYTKEGMYDQTIEWARELYGLLKEWGTKVGGKSL